MVTTGRAAPSVTERVRALRRTALAEPEICPERAVLITAAYREHEGRPAGIRRALAVAAILDRMSIHILDGELIVGNHASRPRAAPIFPEFDVRYLEEELETIGTRAGDRFHISEGTREALRQLFPWWHGRTVKDRVLSMLPDDVRRAGQWGVGVFDNEWTMENGDGHIAVDYPKLLRKGLGGIMEEVQGRLAGLDLAEPENIEKSTFYQSLLIVYAAAIRFAGRFAALARELAAAAAPARRDELLEIARICDTVPARPAESFHEALQSIWFVQLIIQVETNGHSISFGRFDQYLLPWFRRDADERGVPLERLFELLTCFWIKCASISKLRSWGPTRYTAGNPMFQNLTIGGQTTSGDDATNELSTLVLECHDAIRLPQPTLTVRVHPGTPDAFLQRCMRVLAGGGGMPAFFNDEIIIPSLLLRGITKEDAYNYCLVGCVEPSIAGKWGGRQGAAQFHLLKCLEMAMHGGKDPRTGTTLYPAGRTFLQMESFGELMDAFKAQVSACLRLYAIADNLVDLAWEDLVPTPFTSGLVDDCIARGREMKKGGAVYDFSAGQTGHIANVANSLAAVKKLVFDEKALTREELWEALQDDFAGPRGEWIRLMLVNKAPKYGNDDDFVDSIAKEAFSHYLSECGKLKNTRWGRGPIGCTFHPSTASVSYNVPAGDMVGATPDGRRAHEPVADVESPFHGTERRGPTAVVKTVSKLEHIYESGGSILNLKFDPVLFRDEGGIGNLVALLRTYFDRKGMELQIDIVSSATLRDAQKNPSRYADLLVRVAGYSAPFTVLDPQVQNDIIARTEHASFGSSAGKGGLS
jgi:formate C-acetyltransferase